MLQVLHNIDPFRKFAAIRVKQYKLIINQDAVFKTTWHPRYEVTGELDTLPQPSTLHGAVLKCGKWKRSSKAACDTNKFPCLFNIEKGAICSVFICLTGIASLLPLFSHDVNLLKRSSASKGHFQVAVNLVMKARLSAKLSMWKLVLFAFE